MGNRRTEQLIGELLGIAHLFSAAVSDIMEEKLLSKALGGHVTPSQLKILKLLKLADARNLNEVATFLGVSDAAASKLVDPAWYGAGICDAPKRNQIVAEANSRSPRPVKTS